MAYEKGQLKSLIKKLPPEVQDLVLDSHTEEMVLEVGKKYNLHIDLIGELDDEVTLVLCGLTKPNEFAGHIKERLKIDDATTQKIVIDINNQVFLKIRESLQELANNRETTPVVAPVTPTTDPKPQDPMATLGRKYNLSPEQQTNLAAVMAKVKTGEYKLGVLAATLHTTLGVDFKTAEGLTTDLTAQILAAPAPATAGTNIFESKMGQMFKLPKEQVDLPEVKPWSTDPYMEKPE